MKKGSLAVAAALSLMAAAAPAFAGHGTSYNGQVSGCTADGKEVGVDVEVAGAPTTGADVVETLTAMVNAIIDGKTVEELQADPEFQDRGVAAEEAASEALKAEGDNTGYGNGVFLAGLYLTGQSCTPGN